MNLPILCLCLLAQPQGSPQAAPPTLSETTGGLKAEVRTADGIPVAGVQIRLKHRDGRVWVAVTDDKGRFLAGGLPQGEYLVEPRLPGFKGEACTVQIKAQAWLLGIPRNPLARHDAGAKVLRLQGPATYEFAPSAPLFRTRPDIERIPTH
jgi:hypothetical protein